MEEFEEDFQGKPAQYAAYESLFDISFPVLQSEKHSDVNDKYPYFSVTGDNAVREKDGRGAVVELITGPVRVTEDAEGLQRSLGDMLDALRHLKSFEVKKARQLDSTWGDLRLLPVHPPAVLDLIFFIPFSTSHTGGVDGAAQANFEVGCDRMGTSDFHNLFDITPKRTDPWLSLRADAEPPPPRLLWQRAHEWWLALSSDVLPRDGGQVAGWVTTLFFSRLVGGFPGIETSVSYKNAFGLMPRIDMYAWLMHIQEQFGPQSEALADVLQALAGAPDAAARCVPAQAALLGEFGSASGALRDVFRLGGFLRERARALGSKSKAPDLREFSRASRPQVVLGAYRNPHQMQDVAPTCASDGRCLCLVEDRGEMKIAAYVGRLFNSSTSFDLKTASIQVSEWVRGAGPRRENFSISEGKRKTSFSKEACSISGTLDKSLSAKKCKAKAARPIERSTRAGLGDLCADVAAAASRVPRVDAGDRALAFLLAAHAATATGALTDGGHFAAAAMAEALAFLGPRLRKMYDRALWRLMDRALKDCHNFKVSRPEVGELFEVGQVLQQLVLKTIDILTEDIAPKCATVADLTLEESGLWKQISFPVPWGFKPSPEIPVPEGQGWATKFVHDPLVRTTEAAALARLSARCDSGSKFDLLSIADAKDACPQQEVLSKMDADMAQAVCDQVVALTQLRESLNQRLPSL